jgi:PhzF family phenazine biosynthesis protein
VLRLTAFAETDGGGNPAGVVLDARDLDDARMQQIAAEVGYAETAFVVDPAVGGDPRHVRLRFFSPVAEVPFCGHATIATAVALADARGPGPLTVETASGRLPVDTRRRADGQVTAAFTSVEPAVRDLDPAVQDELLDLLGVSRDALSPAHPLLEAYAGNWHPVVVIADRDVFDGFSFDPAAVRALMDRQGWAGTVTVVREEDPDEAGGVFEARNLFPVGTLTEDPATGSAAAALGAYLRELGAVAAPGRLTVLQGRHVGRPSVLHVSVPVTGGITVSGTALPMS